MDNTEELKEIAQYVSEQRSESDLSKVQGYGIDPNGLSVRFSLASIAGLSTEVSALDNSVADITADIDSLSQQVNDLEDSIDELGELPEINRQGIARIDSSLEALTARLEIDEAHIQGNSNSLGEVNTGLSQISDSLENVTQQIDEATNIITELQSKITSCTKVVYDLDEHPALMGEIVQYGGFDNKYLHGRFYEWNGTEWECLDIEGTISSLSSLKRINHWLYTLSLSEEFDYEAAKEYFNTTYLPPASCSSFRQGNVFARNFDWYYNDKVEFIVRSERLGNRLASLSVCNSPLTRLEVESKRPNELYKQIPFFAVDGINEKGVFCNTNVISKNEEGFVPTTGTTPAVEERESICMLMLVRYVLDNFSTAIGAIEYIRDYVSIYAPNIADYEMHFMLGDPAHTYIVEFINNSLVYEEVGAGKSHPAIMTNFIIHGTTVTNSGVNYATVSDYGQGLERYDAIVLEIDDIEEAGDALAFMSSDIKFSNTYTTSNWLSEFTGLYSEAKGGNLTVMDVLQHPIYFSEKLEAASNMYDHRSRDEESQYYGTWQTTHSSVYDIGKLRLIIRTQENSDFTYTFDLFDYPSKEKVDQISDNLEQLADSYATHLVNQASKDATQDTAIAGKQDALTFDSAPTAGSSNPVTSAGIKAAIDTAVSGANYVPYSDNLDAITDNMGVAWMNVGEGREFGHFYKKNPGEGTYDKKTIILPDGIPELNIPTGSYVRGGTGYDEPFLCILYLYPADNRPAFWVQCDGTFSEHNDTPKLFNGKIKTGEYETMEEYSNRNNPALWHDVPIFEYHEKGEQKGGWEDVYDTSTITADITAEVQRATAAEQALSTRIDGKADASTWSATLKSQIDSDHSTLSGLSAKWTDILKSQIDADHTTLGTLSNYLTSAKRTSIDDAIAKAHQQNTDTQLVNGIVRVDGDIARTSGDMRSVGDVWAKGGQHKLSEKLNASMHRNYATLEALTADLANIPEGAWCAVASFESAVSAQNEDDVIE